LDKDELQKFYERRFDLFANIGWTELLEDFDNLKKGYEDLAQINTIEDLWYTKGQVDMINYLLNLKTLSEQAYEELIDEDNE
jgi:hypothetical protein